jgi:hypothetical protein
MRRFFSDWQAIMCKHCPNRGLTRSFRLEISYDLILQDGTDASINSILRRAARDAHAEGQVGACLSLGCQRDEHQSKRYVRDLSVIPAHDGDQSRTPQCADPSHGCPTRGR